MKKLFIVVIAVIFVLTTSCSLCKNPVDKKTGFSEELTGLEGFIGSEDWQKSEESLMKCLEKWEKVKPWMQLEIDHDIINEIEKDLIELTAYLETKEKFAALASIRVVINNWKDIGEK